MRVIEPQDPAATYALVLDALPIVAFMARPDGTFSYVSPACSVQSGVPLHDLVAVGIFALAEPEQRARVLAAWDEARAHGSAYRDEFQLRMADGEYRWIACTAEPMRDPSNHATVIGWFGTITDIEDRRRIENLLEMQTHALRESEARYRAFSEALPGMTWSATPSGELEYVGERWSQTRGRPREAALGHGWLDALHSDDREVVRARWDASIASGEPYDAQFRVRMADGIYRWQFVRALAQRDETGAIVRWIGVNVDIDDQRRADETFRTERSHIEAGLRLLARTSAAALDSLSYRATLMNVARAFVVEFSSYCIIDTAEAGDKWNRTVAHRNPALLPLVSDLPKPPPEHPIARAIEHGESSVVIVDEAWTRRFSSGANRLEATRKVDVRSFISVPVRTPGGEIVGALTCALDGTMPRHHYGDDDLGFVEEVGRRVGAAMANALLYERERRIAVELQSASLPRTLPIVDHLFLDAEYRPGSDEATIGGDWYDAFALDDGRVAITIGDVLGHGLHAAVTMSKLRQSMQAIAMLTADPAAMLAVADRTLRLVDPDGFATAFAGIYDRTMHTIAFASAGHPPPIIRYADGRIAEIAGTGPMLGLRDGTETRALEFDTPPGSTLVLYTDGLIEATRDLDHGHQRLVDALQRHEIVMSAHPAQAIVEHVLSGGVATDDIAVLVAHIRPAASPAANPEVQTTYVDGELPGDAEAT